MGRSSDKKQKFGGNLRMLSERLTSSQSESDKKSKNRTLQKAEKS
jgi:hypothetical protein